MIAIEYLSRLVSTKCVTCSLDFDESKLTWIRNRQHNDIFYHTNTHQESAASLISATALGNVCFVKFNYLFLISPFYNATNFLAWPENFFAGVIHINQSFFEQS